MKRYGIIGVLLLLLGTMAVADTVTYPLVGCEGTYEAGIGYSWSDTINLGVTFSEITSVSIDWSGELYAGLQVDPASNWQDVMPAPVYFAAILTDGQQQAIAGTPMGGGSDYPNPDPFDAINEFSIYTDSLHPDDTWDQWLDGVGNINLRCVSTGTVTVIVEYGYTELDNATLIFEGTFVPEPISLMLLTGGGCLVIRRNV